jgi:hypothetical protein
MDKITELAFTQQQLELTRKATAQEREFVLQEINKALERLNYLRDWVLKNRPNDISEIMTEHLN